MSFQDLILPLPHEFQILTISYLPPNNLNIVESLIKTLRKTCHSLWIIRTFYSGILKNLAGCGFAE
jgi:hypothetical protein